MTELFCDTSYFVALLDPRDELHSTAHELEESIRNKQHCTSSAVLIETLNYFSRYSEPIRQAAADFVGDIPKASGMCVIQVSRELQEAARMFFRKYSDKKYSATDCISMLIMRERGIKAVATADEHFWQEGFEVLLG